MASNGFVIPGTPIAVDFWNIQKCPQAKLFFLTHCHSDHTVGLTQFWRYPLYTSPITAKLITSVIRVKPSLITVLEINEDHMLSLDECGKEMVAVRLIDANHCPGSVMFLFQGYFGNILCTGDFRFYPELVQCTKFPEIDILYLDNTYCNPKYTFYSREDATEVILQRIKHCFGHSERIILGMDNLGKEDLLSKISEETKSKLNVHSARLKTLQVLGFSHITTTDENTNIFVVPTSHVNRRNMWKWNREKRTCAILATARFIGLNFTPYSDCGHICVIPYSNHSSFEELKKFIKFIRPYTIEPFVGKCTKRRMAHELDITNMNVFSDCTQRKHQNKINIPDSVLKFMKRPTYTSFEQKVKKRKHKMCDVSKGINFTPPETCGEIFATSFTTGKVERKQNKSQDHNDKQYTWEIVHITEKTPPQIWLVPENGNTNIWSEKNNGLP